MDCILQNLPLSDLQLFSGGTASVEFGDIDAVFEEDHVILPDLKEDGVKGTVLDGDEEGVVEVDREVFDLVVGVHAGEVEVVLVLEGEVFLVDLSNIPEMQMIKVNTDVLLHKPLFISSALRSITMFHLIQTNSLKLRKKHPARVVIAVALPHAKLALFTDDNLATLYDLVNSDIIEQAALTHTPRRVVPAGPKTLVMLLPQRQCLQAITFGGPKTEQFKVVHAFQPTTHYLLPKNPIKQKEYFSTMTVQPFLLSETFYVQEQNPEGRKCCLRLFGKQNDQWQSKPKELGLNYQRIVKMDEYHTLAVFNPSIEINRSFRFRRLNTFNLQEEEVVLQSDSFTDFSTIIAVKQDKDEIFVQVNRKNPELLCFRNFRESSSEQMTTNVIWMISLGPALFSLCFSEIEGHTGKLQARTGTKLLDEFHGSFDTTSLSKEGLVVEYERQKIDKEVTSIAMFRPVKKDKLFLHLLWKGFPKARSKNTLFNDVLCLLDL